MTTIDHQQKAIWAIAAALHGDACPAVPDPGESCGCGDYEREAEIALTAAAPHLRAAWEQPIRGICEQAIQDKEDSLCRMFNGEPFPAMIPATAVLDLLEGGGE